MGHAAIAVMIPLTVAALWLGYRKHGRTTPLALAGVAAAVAYAHIAGLLPEWTMFGVAGLGTAAAILDWRASRYCAYRPAVVGPHAAVESS